MDILALTVMGVVTGVIANAIYDWLRHHSNK